MRLSALVVTALLCAAHANSYVPPRPMVIGTEFGSEYALKFMPQQVNRATARAKESWGELVRLQPDGTFKTVWKRKLVNTPGRILVSPRGQVVTIDNWAGYGSPQHAVVIYNLTGKVVADLSYAQVVPNPKSCPRCNSMDGLFLMNAYTPRLFLGGNGDEWWLLLRDEKRQGPTIDLKTGQPKTKWKGETRP